MRVLLLSWALLASVLPMRAGGSFFGYLQHTAAAGEAESQFILGAACRDGRDGFLQPGSATAQWDELAAEVGDQRSAVLLGLLRQQKDWIGRDRTGALQWLQLAARRGDDYARVILGDMLLAGDGVPADWVQGAEWIRQSALAGFAPAQFRLGLTYLVGGASTPRDDIEALAWFIVAAEAGSQRAIEYRDDQTRQLGREIAHLALKRSRTLLPRNRSAPDEPEARTQANATPASRDGGP